MKNPYLDVKVKLYNVTIALHPYIVTTFLVKKISFKKSKLFDYDEELAVLITARVQLYETKWFEIVK